VKNANSTFEKRLDFCNLVKMRQNVWRVSTKDTVMVWKFVEI